MNKINKPIQAIGIPDYLKDVINNADAIYGIGPGGKVINASTGEESDSLVLTMDGEVEQPTPKVIGKYKPKTKFYDFIGVKGNINILSKVGFIKGKFFDSMKLENVEFKMTLCDDNTFDFEEVDTNICTETEIKRYVSYLEEGSIYGFRNRSVATDFIFTTKHTVKEKEITVESYLVVEPKKPFNDLLDFMIEEEVIESGKESEQEVVKEEIVISSNIQDKLRELFGDDFEDETPPEPVIPENKEEVLTGIRAQIADEFLEAKIEKRNIIQTKLDNHKAELKKAKAQQHLAFTKIMESNAEIKTLASRIDSLGINEPLNGYYFFLTEAKADKTYLEPSVRELIENKLIAMNYPNTEAFMHLFDNGLFQIRIALNTEEGLTELKDFRNVLKYFKGFDLTSQTSKFYVEEGKLLYEGQMEWSEISNKMVRLGFASNTEFDTKCKAEEEVEKKQIAMAQMLAKLSPEDMMNYMKQPEEDYAQELLDEFEENWGYPMGDEFIFAIQYNAEANNTHDPKVNLVITPKSYFDNEGCCLDMHISDIISAKFPFIHDNFYIDEPSESSFILPTDDGYMDLPDAINYLCRTGLKFSLSFQDFISQKDKVLIQYLISTIDNSIIIP